MFGTVLIANRGEIAVRVARTCHELGIKVVAVYSTEDVESAVLRYADEAVRIGPGPARRSYLNMAAITEAALRTGADAIHPGYGFLSEDADFAEVCAGYGLTLIGPPPAVLRCLGDKVAARQFMADAGLPLLPGGRGPVPDLAAARALAGEIGYPVIVKAAAGGGGRGLQVAWERADLDRSYRVARGSARTLFGDDRVYVERYLASARHVEVQVLADQHGQVLSLGERDCSVQRNYQKLVEETPAPRLPDDARELLEQAAVRGARAVGFVGAGTFEFLVDDECRPYFLEVNGRIQVEHPVTEMVTGCDLVAEQIRVAAGEPLRAGFEPARRGFAIECRVNAEDPSRGFAPAPGVLTEFVPPGGPFVRVDTHAYAGYRVPAAYDSLLAKVVAWAPSREQAIARMRRALAEFLVGGEGVRTTLGLLKEVIDHPLFGQGRHDTSLISQVLAACPAHSIGLRDGVERREPRSAS